MVLYVLLYLFFTLKVFVALVFSFQTSMNALLTMEDVNTSVATALGHSSANVRLDLSWLQMEGTVQVNVSV